MTRHPGQQLEKRLRDWFAATERHALQLHEIDENEYFEMKRREVVRPQQTAVHLNEAHLGPPRYDDHAFPIPQIRSHNRRISRPCGRARRWGGVIRLELVSPSH